MVRPSYAHKKVPCVALYMPMVREHCDLLPDVEKKIKEAIKNSGGVVNGSALFLSTTSTAVNVCRATGVNRRAVLFIPHTMLSFEELKGIEHGEHNFV